jgi:4-azaleucine resistance transporter AzlC
MVGMAFEDDDTPARRSDERARERRLTDDPAAERQLADEPAAERRLRDDPAAERRLTADPAAERRLRDDPAAERQLADHPAAERRPPRSRVRTGVKAGLAFAVPTFALGASFGVLAEPVMGAAAAVVMSFVVFAGAAQFAALTVLAAGGGLASVVSAGLLINARFLPMGLAVAPALRGGPLRRAAEAQAMVDASWALANRGDGTFDRELMLGATVPQALCWWAGTAVGALGGAALGDPEALGLDAMFPAFYLALLAEELRSRAALSSALLGAAIALGLVPFTPPGIPVVAASAAALLGLRGR